MNIDKDVWSSGQVGSKLWLCEELEKVITWHSDILYPRVVLMGGWYGMAAFLLLSRNHVPFSKIVSYDKDPKCKELAEMVNQNWVWPTPVFEAITMDANQVSINDFDIIINTSTEHFESHEWFDKVQEDKFIAIQSNNMEHEDHISTVNSIRELKKQFPLHRILYEGEKTFEYDTWSFTRFMIIGTK